METYAIKSKSDLDKFWQEDEQRYFVEGNLSVQCDLRIAYSLYVYSSLSIEAGGHIKAGGYIEAGGYIISFVFEIRATLLITKTLPFYRAYWAEMPPLKKWKDIILDRSKCWDDYTQAPTKEEAKEICKWDGWHPILRAQLEMFLGLKKQVKWTKK